MIQLKGRRAGFLRCVVPVEMSERQVFEGFSSLLSTGGHLLAGSEIEIDLQTRRFSPALLLKIWKNFIEPSGCAVSLWIADDAQSRQELERIGFRISPGKYTGERPEKKEARTNGANDGVYPGLVSFGTLRGGQNIAHAGDVVIIGNVNRGAEVTAEGNVTVIGRIGGLIHAGCGGSDEMTVITRSLETGQVRIGTKVGIIDRASPFWGKSVTIRILDKEVLVAPWPVL